MIAASSVRANAPGSFALSGANSFAISANSPSRRGGLELGLVIGRGFPEFRSTLAMGEAIQHGIDEAGLVAFEEVARELDIFVDDDLHRNIAPRHQLVGRRAQ